MIEFVYSIKFSYVTIRFRSKINPFTSPKSLKMPVLCSRKWYAFSVFLEWKNQGVRCNKPFENTSREFLEKKSTTF